MENAFAEFYVPSEKDIDRVWEKALVTFDASSLLNLYTLSPTARQEIIDSKRILKNENRLWLSHQAGLEFHRNRVRVAAQVLNQLKDLKAQINKFKNEFTGDAKHLSIAQEFVSIFDNMDKRLTTAIEEHSASGMKDPTPDYDMLLASINELFDQDRMVGKAYSKKKLNALYRVGRQRYASSVPPGFEDNNKPEPFKFGDLIVWQQIIDISKKREVPVILVSDDDKDDWTYDTSGRKHRLTHPMLRSEFKKATGKDFWLYSTEAFLKEAKHRIKADVSEDTLEEVRESRASHPTRRTSNSSAWDFMKATSGIDNSALIQAINGIYSPQRAVDALMGSLYPIPSDLVNRLGSVAYQGDSSDYFKQSMEILGRKIPMPEEEQALQSSDMVRPEVAESKTTEEDSDSKDGDQRT